jgi:hypothetical protein
MANEQTSVPLYAALEVLTAANMNISAGTGVPVFATTVTRDAAFGGANEKTLAEGQLCYLSASNIVQYYDGAAWATVGPSTAGGLVLVSTTTIGSAVSDVVLTNIFSATYDNYIIRISGGAASTTSDGNFILGSTTTGYYHAFIYNGYTGATPSGGALANTTNSSAVFGYSANGYNLNLSMFMPFAAARTSWVFESSTMATTGNRWSGGGFVDNATSYTGMTFSRQGGHTLTGGTIKVYGLTNS